MIRTQIQLTEDQSHTLKRLADRHDTAIAQLIRNAIDNYLDQHAPATSDARVARALAAMGKYRSGHSDVSTRHDEHLDEAYAR